MNYFVSILTLIFVVAKLFDVIDWSWWVVFSPVIVVGVLVVAFIALAIWARSY